MAAVMKTWLAQRDTTLCWIEFEAYAKRVFANDPADWYGDATRYAAALMQAQGVVGTHCLSIDVTAPFMAAAGSREAADLVGLFAAGTQLDFVADALAALAHRFEGKLDLVLKFSAPWDLLGADAVEFDALDDVGTALAACMRRFADRPIAGLLLETARVETLSGDETDAYEPLVSAARHYGWWTAMSLAADEGGAVQEVNLDLDVLLWPRRAAAELPTGTTPAAGGGLNEVVWTGGAVPAREPGSLLYGVIPAAAMPETVLSVTRALQA